MLNYNYGIVIKIWHELRQLQGKASYRYTIIRLSGYNRTGSQLLFELLSEIDEAPGKVVILNTNLEFSSWVNVLYDGRMAEALVGRLMHHCDLLLFPGDNRRLRAASAKVYHAKRSDISFQDNDEKKFTSSDYRFTYKNGFIYAFCMRPDSNNFLVKSFCINGSHDFEIANVEVLGDYLITKSCRDNNGLSITLDQKPSTDKPICFKIELL